VAEGKILIVEDGVSTGLMIGLILTDAGYEVIGASYRFTCEMLFFFPNLLVSMICWQQPRL
jgi:hypothetical protein